MAPSCCARLSKAASGWLVVSYTLTCALAACSGVIGALDGAAGCAAVTAGWLSCAEGLTAPLALMSPAAAGRPAPLGPARWLVARLEAAAPAWNRRFRRFEALLDGVGEHFRWPFNGSSRAIFEVEAPVKFSTVQASGQRFGRRVFG